MELAKALMVALVLPEDVNGAEVNLLSVCRANLFTAFLRHGVCIL